MITRVNQRVAATLLVLAMSACSDRTPEPSAESPPVSSPVTSVSAPPTPPASVPDTAWILHGNDIGEQRHSVLDQINRDNVKDLGLAWSFNMYTRRGVEATPLMVDGTLYVTGSWSSDYRIIGLWRLSKYRFISFFL